MEFIYFLLIHNKYPLISVYKFVTTNLMGERYFKCVDIENEVYPL